MRAVVDEQKMTTWASDDLARIGNAEELELASWRQGCRASIPKRSSSAPASDPEDNTND